jgi:hypothetical protein
LDGEQGNEIGSDEEPDIVLISSSSLRAIFSGIVDVIADSWCITLVILKG